MKYLLSLLTAFLISLPSFSVNLKSGKDPLEITYIKNTKSKPDKLYQEQLRKSESWQAYLKSHNHWFVEFDEATQKPHRAFGKPVSVQGNDPVSVAGNFINDHLGYWKLPIHDLKFQSQSSSKKYFNVFYTQSYKGLDVLNSRVYIKMTKDFRVNTWGIDIYETDISVEPVLTSALAIEKAKKGITAAINEISKPSLKILPVPEGRKVICHLVYELIVSTVNESKLPAKYYTLVDANTGEILYRRNKVYFFQPLNSEVNVRGKVYLHNPSISSVPAPFTNMRVVNTATNFYTDSLGNVSLNGVNPINADFYLEGLYSKVLTDTDSVVAFISRSIPSGADTIRMDSAASIRHLSGYYHVNQIHDFMKGYFPAFTDLDFPLPTRIDVTGAGNCNAFFSGVDINFLEAGSGCGCWSEVGDVVYHEYGHAINDFFYNSLGGNFINSGMHEGYADVWALSLTRRPILGEGTNLSNPSSFIRRYDINRKVYPQDITFDPHDVGEIIAGAWYDVSLNLASWPDMTALYAETFFDLISGPDGDEGQIFSDVLLSALTADDDDADITNGTPHVHEILDAFALHGIYLINNASIEHVPVLSTSSISSTTINADVNSQYPWLLSNPELYYRTDNTSPYSVISMSLVSGTAYTASIPQQVQGTIISYYLKLTDTVSVALQTIPAEADSADANIPLYIIVDYFLNKIEDFDAFQSTGWLTGIPGDNATGGIWLIGTPLVSFQSGGDTCQTGQQHTPGGSKCAVTGNAPSASSPNYNADVDVGKTTLQSPVLNLSATTDPIVSYWRWYTNDQGSAPRADFWRTYISGDGVNFVPIENKDVPDHSWRRFVFKVSDYIPSATNITLRFVADDTLLGSVVEAAVDDIEIFSSTPVGISSLEGENNFSLYPNPANSVISFELNSARPGIAEMEIVDNLGQLVISSSLEFLAGKNTRNVNIQNLANGIYFLQLTSGEGSLQRMFSINR